MAPSDVLTRKNIKRESEARLLETANAAKAEEASEALVLLCCILTHATTCLCYCVGVRVCL